MVARPFDPVSTVFLDRDGTLNVKPPEGHYITSPEGLILLPGVARAVSDLNAAGVRTVLVTNQRWLSGPGADAATYAVVHARLEQLLASEGAWLDAAYHCPHAIGSCDCRKPAPGMLRRAAADHNLDLTKSVIVGDSDSDVIAGQSVGVRTILLHRTKDEPARVQADVVLGDLPAAVRVILATVHPAPEEAPGPRRI